MKMAMIVQYQGSRFHGWQAQSHSEPTVQGELTHAVNRIANHSVELICSGRTDAGVHAIGQVVHFETRALREPHKWLMGINHHLPQDIRVTWVACVSEDFHARFSAHGRRYCYVIDNRPYPSALLHNRVNWQSRPLDAQKMHQAAQALVGYHDFSSFRAAMCQAKHPMRDMRRLTVTRRGPFIFIELEANAFLHHMVRNIAGSLIEIGKGHQTVDWMEQLLLQKDRTLAAATATGQGLYFVSALYPEFYAIPEPTMDWLGV
jgi:tRNA pseudouridine38-40 synthase